MKYQDTPTQKQMILFLLSLSSKVVLEWKISPIKQIRHLRQLFSYEIQDNLFFWTSNNRYFILKSKQPDRMGKKHHLRQVYLNSKPDHFEHLQNGSEQRLLDSEYIQIRQVILNTNFYRTSSRHLRIRLDHWSKKLDQIISDNPWKKNRNNYIKLLYLMSQSEIIVEPFLSLPPEGELPFLRSYEINAIIDLVEQKANDKVKRFRFCRECLSQENHRELPYKLPIYDEDNYSSIEETPIKKQKLTFRENKSFRFNAKENTSSENHAKQSFRTKANNDSGDSFSLYHQENGFIIKCKSPIPSNPYFIEAKTYPRTNQFLKQLKNNSLATTNFNQDITQHPFFMHSIEEELIDIDQYPNIHSPIRTQYFSWKVQED